MRTAREDGGVRVELEPEEADLVRSLAEQLGAVLDAERTDPVVVRLFPSAYEDASDEAEYRCLIGGDLEEHKRRVLTEIAASVGEVVQLRDEQIDTWLQFLTDVRLAIGTRLEVDEQKMAAELDPNDPTAPAMSILHWLGWVQEEIIKAATA